MVYVMDIDGQPMDEKHTFTNTGQANQASNAKYNTVLHPFDHQVRPPFIHSSNPLPLLQVGGHTQLMLLDQSTICKPLIQRELLFYLNIPLELHDFVPSYKGDQHHHPIAYHIHWPLTIRPSHDHVHPLIRGSIEYASSSSIFVTLLNGIWIEMIILFYSVIGVVQVCQEDGYPVKNVLYHPIKGTKVGSTSTSNEHTSHDLEKKKLNENSSKSTRSHHELKYAYPFIHTLSSLVLSFIWFDY